jgi:hypothetical protein
MARDVCDMRQFPIIARFRMQQHRRSEIHPALAIIIITHKRFDDPPFPPKPAKQLTDENRLFPTPICESAWIKVCETDVLVFWEHVAFEYAEENFHCFYFCEGGAGGAD